MKRILVLLSVVALMVIMLAMSVAPAFAAGYGKELNRGTHGSYDNGWHGFSDSGWHGEGDSGVGN